jgi:HSP20 family protein
MAYPFARDLLQEMERLEREVEQLFDFSPTIRGVARGTFPPMNAGSTPQSVELVVFLPGLDPSSISVEVEKGVLTISGERRSEIPAGEENVAVHVEERFKGRFHRVVSLPEDVDPAAVQARYRDGVLRISVRRREEALPRRIAIQA